MPGELMVFDMANAAAREREWELANGSRNRADGKAVVASDGTMIEARRVVDKVLARAGRTPNRGTAPRPEPTPRRIAA